MTNERSCDLSKVVDKANMDGTDNITAIPAGLSKNTNTTGIIANYRCIYPANLLDQLVQQGSFIIFDDQAHTKNGDSKTDLERQLVKIRLK